MKPKGKLEYVDQFRKISILEKLPDISSQLPHLNLGKKQQNTKFIRQRQQPKLNQKKLNQNVNMFLKNQIIPNFVQDCQEQVRKQHQNCQNQLSNQLKNYSQHSNQVKSKIKKNQYRYKFSFQHSSPPNTMSLNSLEPNANRTILKNAQDNQDDSDIIDDKGPLNLAKQKYNFFAINKKRIQRDEQKKEGTIEIKVRPDQELMKKYEKLTLKAIDNINEFHQNYNKFKYRLNEQANLNLYQQLEKKLIINSIVRQNLGINVQFLRDLGLPSRNLLNYVENNFNKHISQKKQINIYETVLNTNIIDQAKNQTQFLQLLRPTQLYIKKDEINFYDMINISTGRITQPNCHLCVRSDKVTRAQYEKALRKLQRYQKIQKEGGKMVTNAEVEAYQQVEKQNVINKSSSLSKKSLIDQILQIKQQWKQLIGNPNNNLTNRKLLVKQIKQRLEELLRKLYYLAAQSDNITYQFQEIMMNPSHLKQIQQRKDDFQFKRIVWFIADIYYALLQQKIDNNNIVDIVKKLKPKQPIKIQYKDVTVINVQKINTEKIFIAKNLRQKQPIISKSPIKSKLVPTNQTPIKKVQANQPLSKTPTKINSKTPTKNQNNINKTVKNW